MVAAAKVAVRAQFRTRALRVQHARQSLNFTETAPFMRPQAERKAPGASPAIDRGRGREEKSFPRGAVRIVKTFVLASVVVD